MLSAFANVKTRLARKSQKSFPFFTSSSFSEKGEVIKEKEPMGVTEVNLNVISVGLATFTQH